MKARSIPSSAAWKPKGLLTSEWREENNRKKRFYRLSPDGKQILKQLLAEMAKINSSLTRIV